MTCLEWVIGAFFAGYLVCMAVYGFIHDHVCPHELTRKIEP